MSTLCSLRGRIGRLLAASALLLLVPLAWSQAPADGGRTPKPVIEAARGGSCVETPEFMRRNHMKLLKHQRDDTLRGGVRTGKYSLKACVECHASKTGGSVADSSTQFCQSCHAYAAVKIDCFECHASKPPAASPHAQVSQGKP